MCSSKSVFLISFSAGSLVNPVQCIFLNLFPFSDVLLLLVVSSSFHSYVPTGQSFRRSLQPATGLGWSTVLLQVFSLLQIVPMRSIVILNRYKQYVLSYHITYLIIFEACNLLLMFWPWGCCICSDCLPPIWHIWYWYFQFLLFFSTKMNNFCD